MIRIWPLIQIIFRGAAYVLPDCVGVNDIVVLHTERIKPHGIRT
ncbi:hypothetical protein VK055_5178 [Klebsiella pneumoniae subsp. pneumoniae]|nr:hypothetical protein VK055_5178 [Klebsiella pneumoniae subsp. pneumoniae]